MKSLCKRKFCYIIGINTTHKNDKQKHFSLNIVMFL